MTDYIVKESWESDAETMYKLSQLDRLMTLENVSLTATAVGSHVATMEANTSVTMGELAKATAIGTVFQGVGNNIKIEFGNGAQVTSAEDFGVSLDGSHNSIVNHGQISSGTDYWHGGRGGLYSGGSTLVTNYGTIGSLNATSNAGVYLHGGGNTVNNLGDDSVISGGRSGISIDGGNNTVTNDGLIGSDHFAAIHIANSKDHQANTIMNSGTIRVKEKGYAILSEGFARDSVVNVGGHLDAGKIEGDISLGSGMDELMNGGFIVGKVDLGGDNDKLVNTGKLFGDVELGDGNDFFDSSHGTFGGRLFGGEGTDTIIGGALNETISGGEGKDVLVGNGGYDTFVFDAKPTGAVDQIRDFNAAEDVIWLDHDAFSLERGKISENQFCFGKKATNTDQRIIYDEETGMVSVDLDGSGTAHKAVAFAQLQAGYALDFGNFILV